MSLVNKKKSYTFYFLRKGKDYSFQAIKNIQDGLYKTSEKYHTRFRYNQKVPGADLRGRGNLLNLKRGLIFFKLYFKGNRYQLLALLVSQSPF